MESPHQPTPSLTYRPATPHDWLAIAPWVERTWGDHGDYIDGHVWQDWLADPSGQLIMAEHDHQPVAFCRLVRLGEAEWWLEGVRVEPARRGRGIGRAMLSYAVTTFRARAHGILRFFTSNTNPAMIRLGEGAGFRHRLSYAQMTAPAQPADFSSFKLLQPHNLDLAWSTLRVMPVYRVDPFAEHHFVAYYLTRDRLSHYLSDPAVQVLGWRQFDALHGLSILYLAGEASHDEEEANALQLGFLAATDDTTAAAMLIALRGLAANRQHDRVMWKMPLSVGLERVIQDTGFQAAWEQGEELWLYELPLR